MARYHPDRPYWFRFLFSPHMGQTRLIPRGPRPGAIVRALQGHMKELLVGYSYGLGPVFGRYRYGQLAAIFADDAGLDWNELLNCQKALRNLLDPLSTSDEKTLRRLAEEFEDTFLIPDRGDFKRFAQDAIAYGLRLAARSTSSQIMTDKKPTE